MLTMLLGCGARHWSRDGLGHDCSLFMAVVQVVHKRFGVPPIVPTKHSKPHSFRRRQTLPFKSFLVSICESDWLPD